MDNSEIKKNILAKRIERGYSQAEVANMLNISQASYQKIEKGDTSLVSAKLSLLADILGVSEEELVLGYMPNEKDADVKLLECQQEYSGKLSETIANYEKILEEKSERIKLLEDAIKDKNEIIVLLKDKVAVDN